MAGSNQTTRRGRDDVCAEGISIGQEKMFITCGARHTGFRESMIILLL
jgi:hypothetical protein